MYAYVWVGGEVVCQGVACACARKSGCVRVRRPPPPPLPPPPRPRPPTASSPGIISFEYHYKARQGWGCGEGGTFHLQRPALGHQLPPNPVTKPAGSLATAHFARHRGSHGLAQPRLLFFRLPARRDSSTAPRRRSIVHAYSAACLLLMALLYPVLKPPINPFRQRLQGRFAGSPDGMF